ncbi:MAG: glycosyltransferase family 2 protein [Vallitaleaceae bacterium]|nr:glycosyltransferase family 2 protein [Vallitaleaceae bacterium]
MFFSIIVPAYNSEKYIRQCLDSVCEQTFEDYELIIVDDGSIDSTLSICQEYCLKFNNINVYNKENGGASSARNVALQHITGQYVIFLDSDDYWSSNHVLNDIYELLVESQADVLYTTPIRYYPNRNEFIPQILQCKREDIVYRPKAEAMKTLLYSNGLHTGMPRYIIKKSIIDTYQLDFVEGRIGEDLIWCAKILLHCKTFDVYSTPFYVYRKREDSVSSTVNHSNVDDFYENIKMCVNLVNQFPADKSQKSYLGYVAFQYGTYMLAVSKTANRSKKDCYKRAKEYRYLLKYGVNKKVKLLYYMDKIIGFSLTMYLLAHSGR